MTKPSGGKHARDEYRRIAEAGTILRCRVGSTVHGLAIEGTDDEDQMGICLEPPEYVIGLRQFDQWIYRTQPEGHRSGPGDLDLTIYSARKWMRLALNGNPTVLLPLFVPDAEIITITDLGRELRDLAPVILSRQAGKRFAGYLEAQRRSLLSHDGKGRDVTRPELVETYGFDCHLDDTEFLTKRGWLTYDEIADDEAIGTVSQQAGVVEFQVPTSRISKPYSGPVHYFRHRYMDCAVTPNHRMWTSPVQRGPAARNGEGYRPEAADWQFRRADTLRGYHHVRVTGAPREDEHPVADEILALVGAYLSEGEVGKRLSDGTPSVLRFTQQAGGRLEPVLAAVGGTYPMRSFPYTRTDGGRAAACDYVVYTLADRELAPRIVSQCGHGYLGKHLPAWAFNLSARQADVLLDALIAGDGTDCRRAGYRIYYSASRRLAGDVQALALIAGRRSNMWGPYEGGMYQVLIQEPGREYVSLRDRNHVVADVTGRRIACFTVPNEILVTRRDGRVSMQGNTKYCGHMVRLGVQGVELLETGRMTLPVPEPWRTYIRELRIGQHSMQEALAAAADLEQQIIALTAASLLPEHPDRDKADRWLVNAYLNSRPWEVASYQRAWDARQ